MAGNNFFKTPKSSPILEVFNLIKNKYVDSVNIQTLDDTAIYAILQNLDPHSTYIPAKDLDRRNEEISGSYYGIGIEFNIYDDTLNVVNVFKDGPANKAGILIGDKIIKVNDSLIAGNKTESENIYKAMRGPLNSVVNLTIFRNKKTTRIPVVRGVIPIKSIDASYMVNANTGFIRINTFNSNTYSEFMQAITALKKNNLQQLILDLRDNGGGVLEEAVEIADEFLEGDKLITYTQGINYQKKEHRCRRLGQFEQGKLIILANEGTASASEILIGALQDWDRATVVGRRTFGKGLVQEQFNLSDKSALRLTVARYFTPLGRSIQRSYAKGSKEYYHEISQRFATGASYYADSVRADTGKVFTTPKGRRLFGAGGISPDYFVGADTGRMGVTTAKLYSKGIFENFGYKYFISNPDLSKKYRDAQDFTKNFNSGNMWTYLTDLAEADSIYVDRIGSEEKNTIQHVLKSSVARQLYGTEGFFEVQNENDPGIKKALDVLTATN